MRHKDAMQLMVKAMSSICLQPTDICLLK